MAYVFDSLILWRFWFANLSFAFRIFSTMVIFSVMLSLYFYTIQIEFVPGNNPDVGAGAIRAGTQFIIQGVFCVAIQANHLRRDAFEM
jgi:hypothetical protein